MPCLTAFSIECDICGIPIENPFLLSSSVVASTYEMCERAFEAGWAGACFKTVSTMDIHEASPRFSAVTGSDGSIIGFKNIEQLSDHSITENMAIFRRLKDKYPSKFILASIMGQNEAEWGELARMCEENGADTVELNFSCPKRNLWMICIIDMIIAALYHYDIHLEPINEYTNYLITEIWIRPTITYGLVACFVSETEENGK